MSARNVEPSIRMTVSGRFGNATRPSAAHSKVGGGTNRRTMSPARASGASRESESPRRPEAAGQKEVETGAVRRRDPRDALAAPRHVAVVELPVEDDRGMPAGRRRFAEARAPAPARRSAATGAERTPVRARSNPSMRRCASNHARSNSARTAGGSAVGLPAASIETSAVRARHESMAVISLS